MIVWFGKKVVATAILHITRKDIVISIWKTLYLTRVYFLSRFFYLPISDLSHSQPVSISLVYVYHAWYINIMILHYFSIFGQLSMSCPGARGDQHCLAPAQWWTNESSLWFLSSQTRLRTYCDGRKLQHSGEYNRLLLKMLYTFVLSI